MFFTKTARTVVVVHDLIAFLNSVIVVVFFVTNGGWLQIFQKFQCRTIHF